MDAESDGILALARAYEARRLKAIEVRDEARRVELLRRITEREEKKKRREEKERQEREKS